MDYLCMDNLSEPVSTKTYFETGYKHQEQCNPIGEELEPYKCNQRFDINLFMCIIQSDTMLILSVVSLMLSCGI